MRQLPRLTYAGQPGDACPSSASSPPSPFPGHGSTQPSLGHPHPCPGSAPLPVTRWNLLKGREGLRDRLKYLYFFFNWWVLRSIQGQQSDQVAKEQGDERTKGKTALRPPEPEPQERARVPPRRPPPSSRSVPRRPYLILRELVQRRPRCCTRPRPRSPTKPGTESSPPRTTTCSPSSAFFSSSTAGGAGSESGRPGVAGAPSRGPRGQGCWWKGCPGVCRGTPMSEH